MVATHARISKLNEVTSYERLVFVLTRLMNARAEREAAQRSKIPNFGQLEKKRDVKIYF